jgi:hypothetical protein
MNKLRISVILSCSCFLIVTASVPQSCNKVETYFKALDSDFNVSMVATFTLASNKVSISNMSLTSTQEFELKNACIFRNFFLGHPICVTNVSDTLTFPIENATFFFKVTAEVQGKGVQEVGIAYGLVDEGSLSFMTGEMFSNEKKCIHFGANNSYGFTNVTQCCTSLQPIQDVSINNTPQCTAFKSRTTVYNMDDNYSIFFTSKINYTKLGQNFVAHGDLSGPTNDFVMYGENGMYFYEVFETTIENLTFPIPYGDNKLLFQIEALNTTERYSPILLAGRILYRNGQTLMEEGIPFTTQNDCQYINRMYSDTQVAATSFCCTKFEDVLEKDKNKT